MAKTSRRKKSQPSNVALSAGEDVSASVTGNSNTNGDINNGLDHVDDTANPNGSTVWQYATKIDIEKARCNICQSVVSRKDQSTTGIQRHLASVHKMQTFNVKTNRRSGRKMIDNLSMEQKEKLKELALNCILEDGRSFNDLRKPGIMKLFNGLMEGFRPPHRNTVNRNLKRLKKIHLKRLSDQLADAQFIGVTTDFWSDHKAMSYICITGHFVTEGFELKSKVLVFAPYYDRHTSENVASELELHLKNLKIYEKTTSITCDGASNMRASFRFIDKKIERIQCLAHKLHLIICNSLGLWIETGQQKDEQNEDDYQDDDDILDHEMKSLSLNNLNNESDVGNRSESDDDSSDDEPDAADDSLESYSMSNDLWESDVTTDEMNATDLQQQIGETMYKSRSIIKMIKKSSVLTGYLDRMRNLHQIRRGLSLDCKSRWNSTKQMLETVLIFRPIIAQLHSDKHELSLSVKRMLKLTDLELSSDQWHLVMAMDSVLTPFLNATKLISGQKYPTIGTCLFAIRKIKQFLESDTSNKPFFNELKGLLLEQLVHYIDDDIQQHELIQFLAYFDPLGCAILTQKERSTIEREIKQIIKNSKENSNVTTNRDNSSNRSHSLSSISTESAEQTQTMKKSIFSSFLHSVSTSQSQGQHTTSAKNLGDSIADELNLYKSLSIKETQKMIDSGGNPDVMRFWQIHGMQLPQLKGLARRYLCTPATSVPSESAFSVAAYVGRKQRARLSPVNLSISVFLKDKLREDNN